MKEENNLSIGMRVKILKNRWDGHRDNLSYTGKIGTIIESFDCGDRYNRYKPGYLYYIVDVDGGIRNIDLFRHELEVIPNISDKVKFLHHDLKEIMDIWSTVRSVIHEAKDEMTKVDFILSRLSINMY